MAHLESAFGTFPPAVELDVCGFCFLPYLWKLSRECHTVAPCSKTKNDDCFIKSLLLWTAPIWACLFLALNTRIKVLTVNRFWILSTVLCASIELIIWFSILLMPWFTLLIFFNGKPTLHSWSLDLEVLFFVKLLDLLIFLFANILFRIYRLMLMMSLSGFIKLYSLILVQVWVTQAFAYIKSHWA